jgi:hypothetical protein
MSKKILYCAFLACAVSTSAVFAMASNPINWDEAVDQAIMHHGLKTEPELTRFFKQAGVAYPPKEIALLAFKQEQHLQLWAKNKNTIWQHIHTYPLTASSGHLGPKLKEHDLQIPEGIYSLTAFNPFSKMHLSMMINYPNAFDRKKAAKEGRRHLGGNIFLHGKAESVGCLAIGNHAIDQLFMLSRRVGLEQIQVIIAPNDLRRARPATKTLAGPRWLPELYQHIESALSHFPVRGNA